MRAAAILGPGNVSKAFLEFQRATNVRWTSLIEQADAIVIFGGDGTIHHQLTTLLDLDVPLLVVATAAGFLLVAQVLKYLVPGRRLRDAGVPRSTLAVGAAVGVVLDHQRGQQNPALELLAHRPQRRPLPSLLPNASWQSIK